MKTSGLMLRAISLALAAFVFSPQLRVKALSQARLVANDRIVFAGDSITWLGTNATGTPGWIVQFERAAQMEIGSLEVVGSGVPGNTSGDLLARFNNTVLNTHPTVIVIWIGVNDVGTGMPLGETVQNFYQMLRLATASPSVRTVVLVTPECIGEKKDGQNALDTKIDQIATLMQDFAAADSSGKISYCPMRADWSMEERLMNGRDLSEGVLTVDGIHPTVNGHTFLKEVFCYQFGLGI